MTELDQLHDQAAALTDPHQHTERIEVWDKNRHRKIRVHTTTQQGLLAQLAELMLPSGNPDPSAGVAASRPPARWDAIATHAQITLDAARWCWNLRLEQRDTVESNIRQLVGVYPSMDPDDRKRLERSVWSWHRQAEIVAGWKSPPLDPCAPCPALVEGVECGERSLRINLADVHAFCGSCGTEWDADTIGLLAESVRAYKTATGEAAQARRAVERAKKTNGAAA
jgi:hypothetical protein